jgi:predicted ATPase
MTQTADTPPMSPAEVAFKPTSLSSLKICGFKSFAQETTIELGGLTILAGVNSSGKSSIMQPLLLMKQTLEAPYDPGALLLDGPNVHFTSGEQLLTKNQGQQNLNQWSIELTTAEPNFSLRSCFNWSSQQGIDIAEQYYTNSETIKALRLAQGMSPEEILIAGRNYYFPNEMELSPDFLHVIRERFFLGIKGAMSYGLANQIFASIIRSLIHVPGIRSNPERVYKTATASGTSFVGQFDNYVASIIDRFQKETPDKIFALQQFLQKLGLTSALQAQRLNDTQIELRVGRVFGRDNLTDMVNIADVGFGVSQILPVLVALLVAQPGQLVYVEQPELHLHPKAQVALAEIFAEATQRGVKIVVETHSELFLLGIQSLVAEDRLDHKLVKLHWFTRGEDGFSQVSSGDLDETGAFGDWPEDFGSIALDLENRYLSAAEAKLWQSSNDPSHL